MSEIEFEIIGEPKGKGRPRFARIGNGVRSYTPKETHNYESFVKVSYINSVGQKKLEGQIEAEIIGIFPIPKSESKKSGYVGRKDITHKKNRLRQSL